MAFDLSKYWTEIASKAGLTEEQTNLVGGALGDEAVSKAISSGFVPRPEVDKALDDRTKEARESAMKEAKSGYDDWYYKEALPTVKNLQDKVKLLEDERGNPLEPLDKGGKGDPPLVDFAKVSKEIMDDVNKLLTDRDAATVNLWEDGLTIIDNWRRQFPDEVFPTTEFREFAEQNNLRPGDAYQKFIAPRVQKMTDSAHEKALTAAKEEGAREALSKHNLPNDPAPKEPSPFFTKPTTTEDGKKPAALSDGAKRDIFSEGWEAEG